MVSFRHPPCVRAAGKRHNSCNSFESAPLTSLGSTERLALTLPDSRSRVFALRTDSVCI